MANSRSKSASLLLSLSQWTTTSDVEAVFGNMDQEADYVRWDTQRILNGSPKREPTAKQQAKADRQEKVIALRAEGHSLEAVAQRTGLSKYGVNKILNIWKHMPTC
jgi:hypothetical protein